MDTPCVALLDTDETLRINTAHGLSAHGLQVYGCRDLAALYRVIDQHTMHAVLLRRAPETAALVDVLLPQLRANYSMSIVVDSTDSSADERLHALQAGADVCLDHAYDMRELAALLRAQTRRRVWPIADASFDTTHRTECAGRLREFSDRPYDATGRTFEVDARQYDDGARRFDSDSMGGETGTRRADILGRAHDGNAWSPSGDARQRAQLATASGATLHLPADDNRGAWWVRFQGWVLVPPQGAPINLTGVERAFFQALLSDPGRELSREALVRSAVGCQVKSISVAISRLRKKVRASGRRLPLHTVHGMGYVFIGRLVQDDSAGA